MEIDVIIPVYNEADCLYANIRAIHDILAENGIKHRFILINDGSRDSTWLEIKRLKTDLDNVSGICFSRNFGKEAAICAGVMEVDAPWCVVMDSDLQHPPQLIPEMLERAAEGFDIVEGVKSDRGRENVFYKLSSKLFYKVINKFSGFKMDNSSDYKLIKKTVVNAWKEMGDTHVFFRGMMEWVGFNRLKIPFEVGERKGGKSKFSFFKLARFALGALMSYSSSLLYITNVIAVIFLIGAAILGIHTLVQKFTGNSELGFSTVIIILLIMGSAILFCLGIIGMYLSKIYDEVKNRPRYLISEKI